MWLRALIVLTIVSFDEAARILGYFPFPSFSHQVTFRALIQELVRRGHDVTVVTPNPAFPKGQTPSNLTEIDVHNISYELITEHCITTSTGEIIEWFDQLRRYSKLIVKIHEKQQQNEEIKDIIENKNDTFDLLLLEFCFFPAWVLTHVIKAPTIFVSSMGGLFGVYDIVGAPSHPLIYPATLRQTSYNLTFWEKIRELYNYYQIGKLRNSLTENINELNRKRFGPGIPLQKQLIQNMEMLFLNVHPIWEGNRPVPPNVVYMGGIHQKPEEELPKNLKSYLDSSKNGVIYISFGTNVIPSQLPLEKIKIFVKVFSKLPYDVLWKYDKDELPGIAKNIRIEKWLPQADLLRHPKVKLFITQGGLQSTDEAITAEVPLIGIPIHSDQWHNVEQYVHHKIGIRVNIATVTEETFSNAIKSVIGDESYRQNIISLRTMMNDQPQRPLDRAVWWVEHVIRHKGAKHLKSAAANLTWAQYYELELITILLVAFLILVLLISIFVYVFWKYISRKFNTVKYKSM